MQRLGTTYMEEGEL